MISVARYICLLRDATLKSLSVTSTTWANILPSHLYDEVRVLWDLSGHSWTALEGSARSHLTETSDALFLLGFLWKNFRGLEIEIKHF